MGLPVLQTGSPSFVLADTGRKSTKSEHENDRQLPVVIRSSRGPLYFLSGLAVYGMSRIVLPRRGAAEIDRSIDSVVENSMIIHALVLALVFAQEQINVVDLRRTAAVEAAAAADIFYDLDRYDPVGNLPLRRNMAEYVRVVIHEEWEELIAGRLSQRAWNLREADHSSGVTVLFWIVALVGSLGFAQAIGDRFSPIVYLRTSLFNWETGTSS